jgi:hypothetical protein
MVTRHKEGERKTKRRIERIGLLPIIAAKSASQHHIIQAVHETRT